MGRVIPGRRAGGEPGMTGLRAECAACRLFIEQMNKARTGTAIRHRDGARDGVPSSLPRLRHFDRLLKPRGGEAPAPQR